MADTRRVEEPDARSPLHLFAAKVADWDRMRIFGTARLLQIGRSRSVRLGAVALACAVAVGGSAQSVSPIPVAEQQSIRTLNDAPNPDTARNASDIRRVAKPTPQTPADPNAAVCGLFRFDGA
ncbi:hypothetical protein [Gordonia sp. (in: high G+C Gram-positive bacteria)]|uniref:hypothetical protein n=1 Tax=Gordonia sp. (in: high G+C Gram-positive bacteria) TaxID=84139 RepID=UPI003C7302B4